MKGLGVLKFVIFNFAMLAAVYFVLGDLTWRDTYAAAEGNAPATSFSLLTRIFSMRTGSGPLASPLTLDWVQLLLLTAALVDVWLLYGLAEGRKHHDDDSPVSP